MSDAAQSLREGRLQDALEQLKQQIRKEPAEARHRVFLFQLLAVSGEWERAQTQLDVLKDLSRESWLMVQTYRSLLHCERLRAEAFAGRQRPLLFGEPEEWLAVLLESLRLAAQERFQEAAVLRRQAFAAAPVTGGEIDGQAFEWIADADTRLGPVLEVMLNNHYYWIPLHRIRSITIEPPGELRDLVWLPAQFTWTNQGEAVGMIPVRYPGSERSDDNAICLARKTVWSEPADDTSLGMGQRMLATEADDYPLLDIRRITLESGTAA